MSSIADRLRAHVTDRGGLAKDADGNPVLPNGAWAMMLEAADTLERVHGEAKCVESVANRYVHERNHYRSEWVKVCSERDQARHELRAAIEERDEARALGRCA